MTASARSGYPECLASEQIEAAARAFELVGHHRRRSAPTQHADFFCPLSVLVASPFRDRAGWVCNTCLKTFRNPLELGMRLRLLT